MATNPFLGTVIVADTPPPGVPNNFLGTVLRSDLDRRVSALETQVAELEAQSGGSGGSGGVVDCGTF